jgi:hypothetical protein
MMLRCPYGDCGFPGTQGEVDEHRTSHAHDEEPQAGSDLEV